MLRKLFRAKSAPASLPALPDGVRVYAFGDIHGRLDLLEPLLAAVEADDAASGGKPATLIFLGDLVDRGPDSARVVERLMRLAKERPSTRFLLGNHEEIMMKTIDGDDKMCRLFDRVGGRETSLSYGMSEADYGHSNFADLAVLLKRQVPDSHQHFLRDFEDMIVLGDYAFVHAGIRPGVPLEEQQTIDLRWIREPFLSHTGPHPRMIVHGHTIRSEVDQRPNRIGIDTGSYATGRLTAVRLEGDSVRFLQHAGEPGA